MSTPDIRWIQRFENFTKAVRQLTRFIEKGDLNEMEEQGLIDEGEVWMDMIKSRALTSHTYNEETAHEVIHSIRIAFFGEYVKLQARFETLTQQAT
jgi:hypothetical protein